MIEYNAKSGSPEKQRSACLVLAVFENQIMSPSTSVIDKNSKQAISRLYKRGDITGECGEIVLLTQVAEIPAERVLLVGCGNEDEFSKQKLQKVTAAVIQTLQHSNINEAILFLPELDIDSSDIATRIEQIIIQADHSSYHFDTLKTEKQKKNKQLRKITLYVPDRGSLTKAKQAILTGRAIASGVNMARDLGNLPGNICTPSYLAEQAKELATNFNMKLKVLNEKAMEKLSMGALLSVSWKSAGSQADHSRT